MTSILSHRAGRVARVGRVTLVARVARVARAALAGLACCAALAGCETVAGWKMPSLPEPWVKPYERERLADPILSFSRDPLGDKHRSHVYEVREAARGATGVQGGGCGCN